MSEPVPPDAASEATERRGDSGAAHPAEHVHDARGAVVDAAIGDAHAQPELAQLELAQPRTSTADASPEAIPGGSAPGHESSNLSEAAQFVPPRLRVLSLASALFPRFSRFIATLLMRLWRRAVAPRSAPLAQPQPSAAPDARAATTAADGAE
mmetsp:Transcript_21833/g.47722  ORF Transcript_21833/g.47722 Transcript_21833/m.47722 type:complete len:153 (+) Transcript_21833:1-459(+)